MKDIGNVLTTTMQKKQCNSLYAFLLLNKKEKEKDNVRLLQSKPVKEVGR